MRKSEPDFRCPNCGTEIDVDVSGLLSSEREKRIEAERERDEFSRGCDRLAEKLRYERLKKSSETHGLQL
jgi:hypothetical protein